MFVLKTNQVSPGNRLRAGEGGGGEGGLKGIYRRYTLGGRPETIKLSHLNDTLSI